MGGYAWEPFVLIPEMQESSAVFECTTGRLSRDQVQDFSKAIENKFFFQLMVNGLPAWGTVGQQIHKDTMMIVTGRELQLQILKTGEIAQVDLHSDPHSQQMLQLGESYKFQLTVNVKLHNGGAEEYANRFDRYMDHDFFNNPIQTFSLGNSLMLVLFILAVALSMIRRIKISNNEAAMKSNEVMKMLLEAGESGDSNDHRIKLKEIDTFEYPRNSLALAAFVGTGWQLVSMVFGLIVWQICPNRHVSHMAPGGRLELVVHGYIASNFVAGFASGLFYRYQPDGKGTICSAFGFNRDESIVPTIAATLLFLPSIVIAITFPIYFLAVQRNTVAMISHEGIQKLFGLWLFRAIPLHVTGTFLARWKQDTSAKPETLRTISLLSPKLSRFTFCLNFAKKFRLSAPLTGLVVFGSMFIKLFSFLTSLWGYKHYVVTWTDAVAFLLSLLTIAGLSLLTTFVGLVQKDSSSSWQWNAFCSSATTGVYCFCYSIYFLLWHSGMTGFYQRIFFVGCMLMFSITVSIGCGAVGHFAAYQSVRFLYRSFKEA